jgi:hypothetical protein
MKFASRRGTKPNGAKLLLLANSLFLAFACVTVLPLSVSSGQDDLQAKESRPDLRSFAGT